MTRKKVTQGAFQKGLKKDEKKYLRGVCMNCGLEIWLKDNQRIEKCLCECCGGIVYED